MILGVTPAVLLALASITPLALVLFAMLPPRRALIATLFAGLLFLPHASVVLPGVPNYTKDFATLASAFLGMLVFDRARLFAFRPRWIDAVMLVFVASPVATSLSNDLGLWDGLSVAFDTCVWAGLPFLLGRLYFQRGEDLRDLVVALFVAGLVYAPLCIWESRMSPHLHLSVYGYRPSQFGMTVRYGGYKPIVFMEDGLMLGLFMASATLAGLWLWSREKLLFGWNVLPFVIGLFVTTILCRSLGPIVLLLVGSAMFVAWRWRRLALPAVALAAFVPFWVVTRTAGLVTTEPVLGAVSAITDAQRANSLRIRLENEDLLAERAMHRPWLGWGAWRRAQVVDEYTGRQLSISDGMWVILLGQRGVIGTTAFYLVLLLPAVLLLLRSNGSAARGAAWMGITFLCVMVPLHAVDSLGNAKLTTVTLLGVGALAACLVAEGRARPVPAARERKSSVLLVPAAGPPSLPVPARR